MHGIKEINFQNRNQRAEEIMNANPIKEKDRDYRIRQEALDKYLKEKYNNVSKVSNLG